MNARQLIDAVTFQARSLEEVPYEALRRVLQRHMVVRVTGLFRPEEVLQARERLAARFDRRNDRKHDPRDTAAVRTNLQKLQIGGATRDNVARFLRIFYNPIFAEDIYGMRSLFVRLARFRNHLFGLPEDYAVFGVDEGFWTASRVNQYPRGGGFMVAHRDRDIYGARPGEADPKTDYQPLLLMSQKGKDFHQGGAFLELDGERVFYEEYCALGDVVVYDGRLVHGVADIDPLEPLDLDTLSGRLAAFVTLYRML